MCFRRRQLVGMIADPAEKLVNTPRYSRILQAGGSLFNQPRAMSLSYAVDYAAVCTAVASSAIELPALRLDVLDTCISLLRCSLQYRGSAAREIVLYKRS